MNKSIFSIVISVLLGVAVGASVGILVSLSLIHKLSSPAIFGSGFSSGGNQEVATSYVASSTSQALCSFQNTTGQDRVLEYAAATFATTSVTGATLTRLTISQSATVAATGTTSYFDNSLISSNGVSNVTPTSTLTGTQVPAADASMVIWTNGNYINFMQASPTSTFSGRCIVSSL